MTSTRVLKNRIRSVGSTRQITKAMQLVAASKMRRAQEADIASAPYVHSAEELLTYLASQSSTDEHALFSVRPIRSRLLIVIASDKGLAGAYNTNIMKRYLNELRLDRERTIATHTLTIGRRATQFVSRLQGVDVIGAYEEMGDRPDGHMFHAILDSAIRRFSDGTFDAVDVIYTRYVSSLRQEAEVRRILPAGFEKTEVGSFVKDAKYEPGIDQVLDAVAQRLVGAQLYQALLDARASEHSMRMLAMQNATENASDLIDDLTLAMNKARQSAITQELAEISSGAEAVA